MAALLWTIGLCLVLAKHGLACTHISPSATKDCSEASLRSLIVEEGDYTMFISKESDGKFLLSCPLPMGEDKDSIVRIFYDDGDELADDIHDDALEGGYAPASLEVTCKMGQFLHAAHDKVLRTEPVPHVDIGDDGVASIFCQVTDTVGGTIKRIECGEYDRVRQDNKLLYNVCVLGEPDTRV